MEADRWQSSSCVLGEPGAEQARNRARSDPTAGYGIWEDDPPDSWSSLGGTRCPALPSSGQLLRAALDEEGSAPFVEDDSAALHGDAKQRRSATVGASFPETQAAAVHPLSRVDRCPSCRACAPTTPRRSWPSNWRTAPTSPLSAPTAAMSSTNTS